MIGPMPEKDVEDLPSESTILALNHTHVNTHHVDSPSRSPVETRSPTRRRIPTHTNIDNSQFVRTALARGSTIHMPPSHSSTSITPSSPFRSRVPSKTFWNTVNHTPYKSKPNSISKLNSNSNPSTPKPRPLVDQGTRRRTGRVMSEAEKEQLLKMIRDPNRFRYMSTHTNPSISEYPSSEPTVVPKTQSSEVEKDQMLERIRDPNQYPRSIPTSTSTNDWDSTVNSDIPTPSEPTVSLKPQSHSTQSTTKILPTPLYHNHTHTTKLTQTPILQEEHPTPIPPPTPQQTFQTAIHTQIQLELTRQQTQRHEQHTREQAQRDQQLKLELTNKQEEYWKKTLQKSEDWKKKKLQEVPFKSSLNETDAERRVRGDGSYWETQEVLPQTVKESYWKERSMKEEECNTRRSPVEYSSSNTPVSVQDLPNDYPHKEAPSFTSKHKEFPSMNLQHKEEPNLKHKNVKRHKPPPIRQRVFAPKNNTPLSEVTHNLLVNHDTLSVQENAMKYGINLKDCLKKRKQMR